MRVRLRSGQAAEKPNVRGWLRPDDEYVVLAIEVDLRKGVFYRIASRQGTPALFEAELFTVTDPRVDGSWVVRYNDAGDIGLTPEAWSAPGFWEDYFNQDPVALERFRAVLSQMS